MKEEYIGFYTPTEEEIDKSWNEGTFIFDANALLNLYRYSTSTRNDFLLVLTKLKDRLFMPHQVGLEFHTNRATVIETLSNSYDALQSKIKDGFEKFMKDLLNQYSKHPSIEIGSINKIIEDSVKKTSVVLEKQKKSHPDFVSKDEILEKLSGFYKNKVSTPFSHEDLKNIFQEGRKRYEQQTPPGYKDQDNKKKKGEQHIYGDLIIWKEIITYASREKKPIILITDDRKEDWWTIESGKTIRPREELVKEFYDLTGIRILIYNADTFLQYAKDRKMVTQIKEASISEVEGVRKSDEKIIKYFDRFRDLEYVSPLTKIAEQLKGVDISAFQHPFSKTLTSQILAATGAIPFATFDDPMEKILRYPPNKSEPIPFPKVPANPVEVFEAYQSEILNSKKIEESDNDDAGQKPNTDS